MHKCKALVISCIDFRFISKIRDFLVKEGLKDNYDLITIPGAALSIEKAASSIITSLNLHDPDEIYIFDHEDCGAYGSDNSKETHEKNLRKANEILLQGNPDKKINIFLAGFKNIEPIK